MKTEKLRTLKDFVFDEDPNNRDIWADGEITGNRELAEELKAEAVKWVKELRNKPNEKGMIKQWNKEGAIEAFIGFFNLIEEDLK